MFEAIKRVRAKLKQVAENRAAAKLEIARKKKIEAVERTFGTIKESKNIFDPTLFAEAEKNHANRHDSADEVYGYFKEFDVDAIAKTVSSIQSMQNRDTLEVKPAFRFVVSSSIIIKAIDASRRQQIINHAIQEHKAAPSNNSVAIGLARWRGDHRLANSLTAQTLANQFQAGAHNAEIKRLFSRHIYNVSFFRSAADMSEQELRYILIAKRFCNFGLSREAGPSLFGLVYKGGQCRLEPMAGDKYVKAAPAEFMRRFNSFIPSQPEATAQLDELIRTRSTARILAKMKPVFCCVTDKAGRWAIRE